MCRSLIKHQDGEFISNAMFVQLWFMNKDLLEVYVEALSLCIEGVKIEPA